MSRSILLGLDIGGGGGRCLAVDAASGHTTSIHRPWHFTRDPERPLSAEIDPSVVWRVLGECVRACLARCGARPEEIAGIAATSMRHASALLAADGSELLLTTNQDARGLVDCLGLAQASGAEFHQRTGHWPNPVQAAGRLCAMARDAPDLWQRAAVHLSLSDWLAARMCGVLAGDASQASETLLFELAEPCWAFDLIDRLGLPSRLFPEIRAPGSRLGGVSKRAAADLGLVPGTPVAVGGGDTQCGLLGAGVVRPGMVGIVAGTTVPLQWVSDRPLLDDAARMWSAHHVVPSHWVLESNAGSMGASAEWAAGLLFADSPHPLLHLFAEAQATAAGAGGMVSTLGAEVMNARQFGLPIGNLTLCPMNEGEPRQRRRQLARAIAEGFAFALRANLEQIESVSGERAGALRVAGGLTRNPFFTQLVSDALDRELEVAATPEASALGAAICAGVGAGLFPDVASGAGALARVARRCRPSEPAAAVYRELYPAWNELRLARAPSNEKAAGLALRGLQAQAPLRVVSKRARRPRLLVTAEMDAVAIERLQQIGDVEHAPFQRAMRSLQGPDLVAALAGVEVFVTEVDPVDAASLLAALDLRVVATCRGGAVNVDVEACTTLGIPVLHAPGRNALAVADLTVAFLLMLARRLPEAAAFLHEPGGAAGDLRRMGRAFAAFQGQELWQKTVGLLGMGAVGRQVIARLGPFGARVLVHDPHVGDDRVRLAGAEPVSFGELLGASDFLSLHASATPETRGLLGAAEFARMRPGSFLVNTARAALVDSNALRVALCDGPLAGAALDVFPHEPPAADDPLLALPNVIATPHVGGNTREVAIHQGEIVASDLIRLWSGEAPHHLLNPAVLAGFDWDTPRVQPDTKIRAQLQARPVPRVTDLANRNPA